MAEQFVDVLNDIEQAEIVLNLFAPELVVVPKVVAPRAVLPAPVATPVVPAAAEASAARGEVQTPISGSTTVSIVLPRGQRAIAYASSDRMLSQNLREYALSNPRDVFVEGALRVEARGLVEVSPIIQVVPVALIVAITKKREVLNRPIRCLIADDQPMNLKILRRLLSSFTSDLGFEIEILEVGNGDVALEILKEHQERGNPIDIAIFDKQMAAHEKGLDGHLAAEEWRAIEVASHLPRMPIIAFTGSTTVEDVAECKRAGIDAFLRKGLDGRAQLLDAILELVHIRLPEKAIVKQEGATAVRSPGSSSFSGKS